MTFKRFLQTVSQPLLVVLLSVNLLFAQDKIVTGKVTDSKDGSPVIGASIVPKGSKTGTTSAADGTFRIKIPSGITAIVITSVGFAPQEIDVSGSSNVSVSLTATSGNLNEVVVVGYGTAKKKDLTGSVVAISSKDFVKGAITTPEQLISGKVAGVQITSNGGAPGAGSTIRIRGGASLNASNDPLIVIDGVPLDNGGISGSANALSLINPNDIESFNILKDASAAAIYGSRASNGVIIITTKKGKRGKPVFSFSTQASLSVLPKKLNILSAAQVDAYVKANGDATFKSYLGGNNTDWQDLIYRNAFSQDNNLSVSGSTKTMPYRISFGFLNQDGILKTGNVKRYSTGINLSPRFFTDHLKVDINIKGSMSKNRFANEGAIGAAVSFDPTQPVYSKSPRYGGYFEWLDPGNTVKGIRELAPRNPLGLLNQRDDRSTVYRGIGNIQFDYKFHFLPELRANLNLGLDISRGEGKIFVNDSAAFAYKRASVDANGTILGSGVNNQYKQNKENKLLEFYLNYVKDLKEINSRIDVMAGYSYQDFWTRNYNYADYFANGAKRYNSDPVYAYTDFENALVSYYGRLNFGIKNRYLLTVTVRRDGSSRFNKENRWGTFPSVATSWKIKDESFLRNVKFLSDLRLRGGWGVTGQQDGINLYDYISYYNLSNLTAQYQFGNTFYQLYRPSGYYPNRTWEQTETLNGALDFGFANNRINGTIEVYKKYTSRLLNSIIQPAGTNFSNTIVANIGSMENKGFEFTINTEPIRKKELSLDVSFNLTYNENKITKLTINPDPNYAGAPTGGISGGVGNTIQIQSVGYTRSAFYVYRQVYDKNNKPIEGAFVDINGDGQINNKDLYRYMGPDPRFLMGMSSSVTYKKFSAGFVMRASLDNYVYNNVASSTGVSRNIMNPLGYLGNGSADILNTNFNGGGDKFVFSDYFIQNGSFLRMDNINVGYNVGKVFNNKANLRIGANVQNVFVITKYKGLDPEIPNGIDNNFYPRPRVFVLTANIDF